MSFSPHPPSSSLREWLVRIEATLPAAITPGGGREGKLLLGGTICVAGQCNSVDEVTVAMVHVRRKTSSYRSALRVEGIIGSKPGSRPGRYR